MQKHVFTVLSLVLCTSWCLAQKTGKTPSGCDYVIHRDLGKPKGVIGQMVALEMTILQDTTLIGSTKQEGEPVVMPIMDPKEVEIYLAPLEEALVLIGEGDSISLVWNVVDDGTGRLPEEVKGAKQIFYHIGMLNYEEAVARQNQGDKLNESAAAAAPPEPEVKELTENELMLQAKYYEVVAQGDYFKSRATSIADSTKTIATALIAGTQAGMQTTASGIKYYVIKNGNNAVTGKGKTAIVHCLGTRANHAAFYSSFEAGTPLVVKVGVGQVIAGWDELLSNVLNEGGALVAILPNRLAYGNDTPGPGIEPGDDLVFYLESAAFMVE